MSVMELTLVVAATRNMGIGARGTLPWTGLKKEMAYFARVTKRLPSQIAQAHPEARNVVIMGRKTWDSIPPKFRPLKGRMNIIISRSYPPSTQNAVNLDVDVDPVQVSSLRQAISYLHAKPEGAIGNVFVIGGAQIYEAALELPEAKRLLITRIHSDFECDAFFPLTIQDGEDCAPRWSKRPKVELDNWVGETVPDGIQEENSTRYEFQMWERSSD
jgi:dihydrofolate reductase